MRLVRGIVGTASGPENLARSGVVQSSLGCSERAFQRHVFRLLHRLAKRMCSRSDSRKCGRPRHKRLVF